jgi:hypothetical protein
MIAQANPMFEFINRKFAARAGHSRPPAGDRAERCRLKFECLESRCLLFAAPMSFESFLDLHTLPTSDPEVAPPPTYVSLDSRSANSIRFVTPEHRYLLPLPPSADGSGHSDWPQLPPSGPVTPVPPPSAWLPDPLPGDSSLGGFSDIGELDSQGQATFSGGESSKDVREVLELLAALQYVPDARPEISDDLLATLAADLASATPAVAAGEPSQPLQSPGGMVELVREMPMEGRASDQESGPFEGLPLDVSVTMDVAYGRYQAFEVSTRQALPPPPAPTVNDEASSLPNSPGAAAPASLNSEPPPYFPAETTGAAHDSRELEELNQSESSPTPVLDASGDTTNRVLGLTAAAALVAYAARNNPAASAREPDKRKTVLNSLHTIVRWPVNEVARLIKVLTRQSAP